MPLVRTGGPPSALSESFPGAATVEKRPSQGAPKASSPSEGVSTHGVRGLKTRTRCLFRERVPLAEDSQAKTSFSGMKLEIRRLLIKIPCKRDLFYEFLGDPPVSKVVGLSVISCHRKEQINSICVTPYLSVSEADITS